MVSSPSEPGASATGWLDPSLTLRALRKAVKRHVSREAHARPRLAAKRKRWPIELPAFWRLPLQKARTCGQFRSWRRERSSQLPCRAETIKEMADGTVTTFPAQDHRWIACCCSVSA